MMRKLALGLGLLLAIGLFGATYHRRDHKSIALVTLQSDNFARLQEGFNAAHKQMRFIVMLSPT